MTEIDELQRKCAEILLNGNLTIDEETGILSFDVSEENKIYFIEYAVNDILYRSLSNLEKTVKDK
jgi:hypothetical protein